MEKDYTDSRVRHLELIQAVITRLASNNASHKNYCITLVSAGIGLAAVLDRPLLALVALVPTIVFATLDAQYLRVERRYRLLYDQVRSEPSDVRPDFRLRTSPELATVRFWSTFWSWSIQAFYLPTSAGILLAIAAMELIGERDIL